MQLNEFSSINSMISFFFISLCGTEHCCSFFVFQSICSRFSDFLGFHDVSFRSSQSQLLLSNRFCCQHAGFNSQISFVLRVTLFGFAIVCASEHQCGNKYKRSLQNYFTKSILWGVHYMRICTQINNGNNDPIKVFMTFICDDEMKK